MTLPFAIHLKDSIQTLLPDTVLYIHAKRQYSTFHLTTGEILQTSKTLKYWETQTDPSDFLRINRSVLINLAQIKTFNERIVRLVNKEEFPISLSSYQKIKSHSLTL